VNDLRTWALNCQNANLPETHPKLNINSTICQVYASLVLILRYGFEKKVLMQRRQHSWNLSPKNNTDDINRALRRRETFPTFGVANRISGGDISRSGYLADVVGCRD
jgi:hypothetical protein